VVLYTELFYAVWYTCSCKLHSVASSYC